MTEKSTTVEIETSSDDVALEVGYALLGRAHNIHENPDDEHEDVAEELKQLADGLIDRYEDPSEEVGDGVSDDGPASDHAHYCATCDGYVREDDVGDHQDDDHDVYELTRETALDLTDTVRSATEGTVYPVAHGQSYVLRRILEGLKDA